MAAAPEPEHPADRVNRYLSHAIGGSREHRVEHYWLVTRLCACQQNEFGKPRNVVALVHIRVCLALKLLLIRYTHDLNRLAASFFTCFLILPNNLLSRRNDTTLHCLSLQCMGLRRWLLRHRKILSTVHTNV